jgi:uncharacterized protein YkwD
MFSLEETMVWGMQLNRRTTAAAMLTLLAVIGMAPAPQAEDPQSQLIARSDQAVIVTRPIDGSPQSAEIAVMERQLIQRINEIRILHALKPLEQNEDLNRIARGFSFRMNRFGFFGHYDHAGNDVADRLRASDIRFALVAENIAKNINFSDPVDTAIDGWMKSDGHRANILTADFRETGVGIWKDGSIYHLTQVFLNPW